MASANSARNGGVARDAGADSLPRDAREDDDDDEQIPITFQSDAELPCHIKNVLSWKESLSPADYARIAKRTNRRVGAVASRRKRILLETCLTVDNVAEPAEAAPEDPAGEDEDWRREDDVPVEGDKENTDEVSTPGRLLFGLPKSEKKRPRAPLTAAAGTPRSVNRVKLPEGRQQPQAWNNGGPAAPTRRAKRRAEGERDEVLLRSASGRTRQGSSRAGSPFSTPRRAQLAAERSVEQSAKRRRVDRSLSKYRDSQSSNMDDEPESDTHNTDSEEGEKDDSTEEAGIPQHAKEARRFPRSTYAAELGENNDEEANGAGERGASVAGIVVDAVYETYFQTLHEANNTSNHTLAMLPVLEHKEFAEALARARPKHELQIDLLASLHTEQFRQWYFELHSGFNLVFFGYGSKRDLLSDFAAQCAEGFPLLVVNGYFPSVGPRDFLAKILNGVLGCPALAKGTVEEQAALVTETFAEPASDRPHERMYVLVHNIDGPALRAERTQAILSVLAACPKIHMIASVDHVNAPLLWDTVKAARFNWLWHDATTFQPYAAETTFENSIMVRRGELGPRGVGFVLASLTANMKKIFRILAEHQIAAATDREALASDVVEERVGMDSSEENEEEDYEGVAASGRRKRRPAPRNGRTATPHANLGLPYQTFYSLAREAFLTNSDQAFQSQLTEFRDHRIIHSRRAGDGTDTLYIPLAAQVLAGVLEKMEL